MTEHSSSPPDHTNDGHLARVTVGEVTLHNDTIEIADYDPAWPKLFEQEKQRILQALDDEARLIEHVGSTSVPMLPAKPVIDILLAVTDSANETSYKPALDGAGYVLRVREPDWFGHRLFKRSDPDVNLHVFTVGTSEIDRMIRFREHLRSTREDRERYGAVKRNLAGHIWRHVQDYADAKNEIVEAIHQNIANRGKDL